METGVVARNSMPGTGSRVNPLSGNYLTSDGGTINLCILSPTGLIRDTFEHLGLPELADDPRFSEPLKLFENAIIAGGYIADAETLKRLEGEGLVAFRYKDFNPNGSMNDIAGLRNERGNVVGLMPHPEHAVEPGFGPDTNIAMRSGIDGLKFFTSVLKAAVNA